jgi:hypothetical protein
MDALFKLLDRANDLSVFDTALLICVSLLVIERIKSLVADLKCARERITRLEKALLVAGIELGEIEEE